MSFNIDSYVIMTLLISKVVGTFFALTIPYICVGGCNSSH